MKFILYKQLPIRDSKNSIKITTPSLFVKTSAGFQPSETDF